jgi:metal-responsive CopG/Arc/MetJ family transcriptional regulator
MVTKRVTLSLPTELVSKAKEFSKNSGSTFSGLVRICLQNKLMEKNENNQISV